MLDETDLEFSMRVGGGGRVTKLAKHDELVGRIRELEGEVATQQRDAHEWESRCYQSIVATKDAERQRCLGIVCRARDDVVEFSRVWRVLDNLRRDIEAET